MAQPKISINDAILWPGFVAEGGKDMVFSVTMDAPQDEAVTVHVATADVKELAAAHIEAFAGTDYDARSTDITFAPGEVKKDFAVKLHGRPKIGPDIIFEVVLTLPPGSPATSHRKLGAGIIKGIARAGD